VSKTVLSLDGTQLMLQTSMLSIGMEFAEEDVPPMIKVGRVLVVVMKAGQEYVRQCEHRLPQLRAQSLHEDLNVRLEMMTHHLVLIYD